MATTDIGRAVPLLRGEYDPAQTYELNDIVSLNGSLYWHYSHEVTTNVAPQATSTWKIVLSLTDAEAYIARAETAAEEAESAKDDAVTAKTAAETASAAATGASEAATAAKDDAVTARNAAQTAETGAVEAKNAAVSAKEAAQSAASSAGTSATNAGNSAGTAEYYAENAETAAATATTKASEASASATTASSAATTATEAKNTAVSSASTATTKAGEASTSATSAASSAAAAQAVKDSIPEDYSALSEDVGDLKTHLNTIAFISENVAEITDGITQTHSGVTYYKESENTVGIYGASGQSSQRFACFNGNNAFGVVTSLSPTKNMEAGTYTAEINGTENNVAEIYYTTSKAGAGVKLNNGTTFTTVSDFALFVLVYANKTLGTQENPKLITVHLYTGSGESTAIDNVARSEIEAMKKVKYVSTTGNDNANGDTPDTAYATIAKAISETANTIYIKHGIYNENSIPENTAYRYTGIKIVADDATIAMSVQGMQFRYSDVDISGITFDLTNASSESSYGLLVLNCTGKITDCTVIGAKGAGGFRLDGSKITLERCSAIDCKIDGFNGHTINTGYETECTLIDCIAHDCGDDGASIHENGKMYVHGGEYYNNVQTGLAPHDKCEFEAFNVHCHNNGIGIEAVKDSLESGDTPATGKIIGCILNDNITYGLDVKNYTVNTLANGYSGNGAAATRAQTGGTINSFTVS